MIQQHERLVYKVCSIYTDTNEDSRDLFQEIIMQAWRSYPKFKGEAQESTWLYRVALNTAINHQRKKNRSPVVLYPELLHQHPEDQLPDAYKEEYKILQRMIAELPRLDKALILLYLEDRSYNEIAEILGISPSNVGTKLNRIKDRMKKQAQPIINN
ncbi:MAG: RNA polymerase sigma factor [Chitinophagales bacterium]|nr:RNA polymerase sigma factor [Chitinophagales bacterium]